MQLAIFEGRGPVHEKGTLILFKEGSAFSILLFRFINGGSTVRMFTDVIALKDNDFLLPFPVTVDT